MRAHPAATDRSDASAIPVTIAELSKQRVDTRTHCHDKKLGDSRTSSKKGSSGIVRRRPSLEELVDVSDQIGEVGVATCESMQRSSDRCKEMLLKSKCESCRCENTWMVLGAPVFCRKNSQPTTSSSTRAA